MDIYSTVEQLEYRTALFFFFFFFLTFKLLIHAWNVQLKSLYYSIAQTLNDASNSGIYYT